MTVEFLKETLGECKNSNSFCINKSGYETCSDEVFFLKDQGDQAPVILCEEGEKHITVNNPNGTLINIAKIDSCIITQDIPKCDCLLFNEDSIYLIEMKDCKRKNRKENKKKAIKQLLSTLEVLHINNPIFKQKNINAIIGFRKPEYNIIKSTDNTQKADFWVKYKALLGEGMTIAFV